MSKHKNKSAQRLGSDTEVMEHDEHSDDVVNLRHEAPTTTHALDVEVGPDVDEEADAEDAAALDYDESDDDSDEDGDDDSDEVEELNEGSGVETEGTNPDSVYTRLLECARQHDPDFQPKGASEPYTTFCKRLVKTVNEVPEEAWNALGEEAQVIYNAIVKVLPGRPPEIPGLIAGAPIVRAKPKEKQVKAKSTEELAERGEARVRRKAEAAAKREAKLAARKAKGPSKVALIRRHLLANLHKDLSLDELTAQLAEQGVQVQKSTMQTLRNEIRVVSALMRDMGLLREGV